MHRLKNLLAGAAFLTLIVCLCGCGKTVAASKSKNLSDPIGVDSNTPKKPHEFLDFLNQHYTLRTGYEYLESDTKETPFTIAVQPDDNYWDCIGNLLRQSDNKVGERSDRMAVNFRFDDTDFFSCDRGLVMKYIKDESYRYDLVVSPHEFIFTNDPKCHFVSGGKEFPCEVERFGGNELHLYNPSDIELKKNDTVVVRGLTLKAKNYHLLNFGAEDQFRVQDTPVRIVTKKRWAGNAVVFNVTWTHPLWSSEIKELKELDAKALHAPLDKTQQQRFDSLIGKARIFRIHHLRAITSDGQSCESSQRTGKMELAAIEEVNSYDPKFKVSKVELMLVEYELQHETVLTVHREFTGELKKAQSKPQ
jgi:hypothetical protein